jgi:hypothetical protein
MVSELIFIFFSLFIGRQADRWKHNGSETHFFVSFPRYMNWSSSYSLFYRTSGRPLEAQWEWTPFFIGFSWWMIWSSSFAFLLDARQTDESAMWIKPIFISFPWYMNWSSSSSLNKQQADRRRDKSMRAIHIFVLVARWLFYFFYHDDEIILASCLNSQTVGVPSLCLPSFFFMCASLVLLLMCLTWSLK